MTKVMLFFVSAVFHQAHKAIENTGVLTPLAANAQRVASIFEKGNGPKIIVADRKLEK